MAKKIDNKRNVKLISSKMLGQNLQDIANILRRDSLEYTSFRGFGHPTSCLSCAEIISVLFFDEMKYDDLNIHEVNNDEFILSKGHAEPILYSALKRASELKKIIKNSKEDLIHAEPWVKVSSGSFSHGLSLALGCAIAQKKLKIDARSFILLGDREISSGFISQASEIASFYKLNNLVAIYDMNRHSQEGLTQGIQSENICAKNFRKFGWSVFNADGHDILSLKKALNNARKSKKPVLIIAKTYKGRGVSFLENKGGWHGKALTESELSIALKEIPNPKMPILEIKMPYKNKIKIKSLKKEKINSLDLNEMLSTKEVYKYALNNLSAKDEKVISLDKLVNHQEFIERLKKEHSSEHKVESSITEQNLIGIAEGLSLKGFHVYSSTFASLLSKEHDLIKLSSIANANITLVGGEDDFSSKPHLEDLSLFRELSGSIIFYPSDAISTIASVRLANENVALKYIKTSSLKFSVIYDKNEKFETGDFKVLKESQKDRLVLIGSGVTLYETLVAYEKLLSQNIFVSVIDLYCIKPLNIKKLIQFVQSHGNKVIISEEHYSKGGIGEMLSKEFLGTNIRLKTLHVNQIPHQGTKEEFLNLHGINAKHIAMHAKTFI